MSTPESQPDHGHEPVLLRQTLELLAPGPDMTIVDGTIGRGGHAEAIVTRMQHSGTYVGFDRDKANLEYAAARLGALDNAQQGPTLHLCHDSFANARIRLTHLDIDTADRLLADLGFASTQVNDASRGLAFAADGPLDMRLNVSEPTPTAADLIAQLPEKELADVIYRYGEERLSRKIARKITLARQVQPITTTRQLADLVRRAYGPAGDRQRIHPATRTFQALRIAVNGELDALAELLKALPDLLKPQGVAVIISFHSLEDRPVKQRFAELERLGVGQRLTRKPIRPDDSEVALNPRSRSARLRAFVRH